MPGELLPTMAAPSASKSQLARGKPDLYLIVSLHKRKNRANGALANNDYSPRKTRFMSKIFFEILEAQNRGWHTSSSNFNMAVFTSKLLFSSELVDNYHVHSSSGKWYVKN